MTPFEVVETTFLPGLDTTISESSVPSKQYLPELHGFTVGEVSGEQMDPEGHG